MTAAEERRSQERIRRRDPMKLTITTANDESLVGRSVRCTTADISEGGLQVQLGFELPVGSELDMCVEIQGQPVRFHLAGTTRWCAPLEGSGGFAAGIELNQQNMANLLSWEQLFYD